MSTDVIWFLMACGTLGDTTPDIRARERGRERGREREREREEEEEERRTGAGTRGEKNRRMKDIG